MGGAGAHGVSRVRHSGDAAAVAGMGGERDAEYSPSVPPHVGTGRIIGIARTAQRQILASVGGSEKTGVRGFVSVQRGSEFCAGAVGEIIVDRARGSVVRP